MIKGIQDLVENYGKSTIRFLDSKTKLNTGDLERDAEIDLKLKPLRAIINKGAIKNIKEYTGSATDKAKAEKRLKVLKEKNLKILFVAIHF
mgnify:CR=1 FL=1